MSLFEDPLYQWRETYFIYVRRQACPNPRQLYAALDQLGRRYELTELRITDQEELESLTLFSPADFAAMDISMVCGEDVVDQLQEARHRLLESVPSSQRAAIAQQLDQADARIEVYHFEQLTGLSEQEDEDFLDPGSLLIVLEKIAQLCHGVIVDPQAGCVM